MNRTLRASPVALAVLAALVTAAAAGAQSLPPQPVPVAPPPTVTPGPAAPPSVSAPPPLLSPAPPPDYPAPLPASDALLEAPSEAPGWFGGLEFGIVKPHVNSNQSGMLSFGSLGLDTVQLPMASLDAAVAVRFDLGYRLADNCGGVLVSYRTLSTEGHATILDFDPLGDGQLRSRLDMDVFDFDYVTPTLPLGRRVDLRARLGVRLADVFFDSRALGQVFEQRQSNHFIGAGPHAGLDLWYHSEIPGLGVFARVDGALPIGSVHQNFEESFELDDGTVVGSAASQSATRVVPTISAQVGVGWQPMGTRLLFSAGYEFEYWWDIGHVGDSRATLWDQGGFFRVEFRF
jgi:hypothetical protein